MKQGRILAFILLVALVVTTGVMAKELSAVKAPKGMRIDGKLTEWEKAKKYAIKIDSLEYLVAGSASEYEGGKDIAGTFYVMWDAQYLYIAAEITDDKVFVDHTGAYLFQSDGIQVFVSFDGVGYDRTSYGATDFQFGFAPGVKGGFAENHVWNNNHRFTDLQFESSTSNDGYIIEVAIPAYEFDIELEKGMLLGFDLGITDTDYEKTPQQNYFILSKHGDGWGNVSRFLELLLID